VFMLDVAPHVGHETLARAFHLPLNFSLGLRADYTHSLASGQLHRPHPSGRVVGT
jgi:hypothetical protein